MSLVAVTLGPSTVRSSPEPVAVDQRWIASYLAGVGHVELDNPGSSHPVM